MDFSEALTFNDILMVPQYSEIKSRKNIDISTNLCGIKLHLPILSAPMDTITEDDMAINLAKNGGLGIIHRFNSIDKQVELVKNVKRFFNYKITDPYFINNKSIISNYLSLVKKYNISYYPVVDDNHKLVGIISKSCTRFCSHYDKVSDIMISDVVCSDFNITLEDAYNIMKNNNIGILPLVDNINSKILCGLITLKDILRYNSKCNKNTIDKYGRLSVGAAVGIKDEDYDRAVKLIDAGVDILCIDVAHGHNKYCGDMIKRIKQTFPNIPIIAGNVATGSGVQYLAECGADCVKVSIGCGSICTTRIVTGCGVPQVTALIDSVSVANKYNIPIISDGGNGGSIGNILKALSLGSTAVMLGNFLSGTDETPGHILLKDNKRVKYIRGMSGYGANLSRKQTIDNTDDMTDVVPEGVDAYVTYKGSVLDILTQIIGGIKSGMSYNGSNNLKELVNKVKFIKITSASQTNSKTHGVTTL